MSPSSRPVPADEGRHAPGPEAWWYESWWFDVWTPEGVGVCTSLTVLPVQGRVWYLAALVRPGAPLLHLADLEVPGLRPGLEVRTHGLWASHTCEAPFEQWTVANEAYAVALDDPADALGRALGAPAPVAVDLEWYAGAPPVLAAPPGPGAGGYRQPGTVEGVVELAEGPLALAGAPSVRGHAWGVVGPASPPLVARPQGAWVPFVLEGPVGAEVLDRVLTRAGWWEQRRPA